jgi:tetratricopeptide (TPR) repeat protein
MNLNGKRLSLAEFEREIGTRLGAGDLVGAASVAADCRVAWPQASAGWLLGSIVALLGADKVTALALMQERLAAYPRDVQCLLQKAECLQALGDHPAAIAAAEDAATHSGDVPETLEAIAEFLRLTGEQERAIALCDRGLARSPRHPELLAKRALVHRALGNLELAERDYETLLSVNPVVPVAFKALSELRKQTPERHRIPAMEQALKVLPPDSTHAAIVHFGLAKTHEDLGNYAASWQHVTAANRVERLNLRDYDVVSDTSLLEAMEAVFSGDEASYPDTTGQRPVFVVGLPRTGTTLVERIVSNHPEVHSGGELSAMPDAIGQLVARAHAEPAPDAHAYAQRLDALKPADIAQEYLDQTRTVRRDPLRLLDKQLSNFIHCRLILRAFPNARIIHITRHPLAACYAIFRNRFNGTYPFSYDLGDLSEFYVRYRALMTHWHRVLPGKILDVAYEDVVNSLESQTRRILAYLDLPFDPACLEFHRNPTPVMTASSVQVRQPLYDSSLQRWKHYEAGLAPVRARLEAAGIPLE